MRPFISIAFFCLLFAGCSRDPDLIHRPPDEVRPMEKGGPSWPRFLGPKGDNVSTEAGLLTGWPEGGPKLLWTAAGIGQGHSSVTVADGRIYTAGNLGKRTVVSALDLDGEVVWQAINGDAWTKNYAGTRGTPTVDGDCVYHENASGDLICLSTADGAQRWQKNILKEFRGQVPEWGLAESVLIDSDRVICCPGGRDASVAALDKHTGETVWTAADSGDNAGYGSPVLAECGGLRIVLTMTDKSLIGVDADAGELLFRHEHRTKYDVNATSPVYHDGKVLITSGYGAGTELLAIRVDGRTAAIERIWKSDELDNHFGGVVFLGGRVYGSTHNGPWLCLDWTDGRQLSRHRGVGKGALTAAEGLLYTLGEKGEMAIVRPDAEEMHVAGRFRIPTAGEEPSWAYPVVCGSRLYIRHGEQVFAYDVRAARQP